MFTTYALLAAAGVGFWLALSWGLRRRYDLRLTIPQALAGLPDWLSPIPLPFSFMLGIALTDLLTRRVAA